VQSGSARTPLAESMLTDNEVTASEAIAILGNETSREVVSANSKVADSTTVVPETQNPMLHAEDEATSLTANAGFTYSVVDAAAPNFPHNTAVNNNNAETTNLTVNTGSPNLTHICDTGIAYRYARVNIVLRHSVLVAHTAALDDVYCCEYD